MLKIRHAATRGRSQLDWLDSYHSFSFNEYTDPDWHHFHDLRVINEDYIAPQSGFDMHSHKDMEILTYVLQGSIAHQDSLGHHSVLHAGEWQRMTAGTGITHSEQNHSDEKCHLFQIWIRPSTKGLEPSYEQKKFEPIHNQWQMIVSAIEGTPALLIHQNVSVSRFEADHPQEVSLVLNNKPAYIQVVRGDLLVADLNLADSDALIIEDEVSLSMQLNAGTEIVAFVFA